MLGLNCLIKDTRAAQDIKDAIAIMVGDRVDLNKSVSFPVIYRELRREGLEVDAESAGALYNEVFGSYNDAALSTEDEILDFVGKDVVNQQMAIVDAMAGATPTVKEQQIGNLPPEKQVATMIAQMFKDATFGASKNVNSVMKEMEALVGRAARALLPDSKRPKGKTFLENLSSFFDTEATEFQTLSGGVNTLQTLHTAVKAEVDAYLNDATDKLNDDEAEALREKWAAYTNGFIQSTYDIMLGKSDQNKLLNEALRQVEVDGLQVVDVNGNVKWSALMEEKDPTRIGEGVKKLFQDGIKDESGNVVKYSREQAERIGAYFQRLYDKKLAAVKLQKLGNNRSKNQSAKNIVSDFIKDRGFINLVKDKQGNLLLTQANWEKALEAIRRKVGDRQGVDVAVDELKKFLSGQEDTNGNPKYTNKQVAAIVKEFRDTVAAKLVPGTAPASAMERLVALSNLNGGKAFQESTQVALNSVLGIGDLDQQTINQIKQLTNVYQSILTGSFVSNSTSPDTAINRGAYAFQAQAQIQRRIKEIVHTNKLTKSQTQVAIKYIADVMNAASTSLLINPGNFGENILTGIASNIGESVTMLFTNPKLYTKFGSDFWVGFASHFSGGVANEVIAEQDATADIQGGERLRFRKWVEEFVNAGIKGKISAVFKTPAYAVSMVSRAIMNSFDAGFSATIMRKKAVTSVYNALRSQGMSSKEVLAAMDASLHISDEVDAQLDAENTRIKTLLESVGLHPTAADMELNKRDMKLAMYEDAFGKAAANNGVKTTPRQIAEITKATIESASNQAKILTGKKNIPVDWTDPLTMFIYGASKAALWPQQQFFKSQVEQEKEGNLKAAAAAQFGAELWKNTVGRFAGGIANFLALAVTATPYGFVTANSLRLRRNNLKRKAVGSADVFAAEPGDIRRYAEFHNLMRSMVVRATMGTLAVAGFVATRLMNGDDDDEDGMVSNLMQTKSGRRLMQKYLPLSFNVAASFLYDVDDPKYDDAMERLVDVMGNTTGQTFDKWGMLKTSMSRAKNDEDKQEAWARYFGSTLPTMNINQAEQSTKFWNVLKSAVDKDYISEVERDEAISKAIYADAEDAVDIILTNGLFDAFRRLFNKEENFNRYLRK